MNINSGQLITWLPRILTILFSAFLTLFAFDVFGENEGFWNTLLAFLIHLIPTFLVVILLVLSWRWPLVGAVVYVVLGILYIVGTGSRVSSSAHWIIAGPLVLIGILFLVDAVLRMKTALPE